MTVSPVLLTPELLVEYEAKLRAAGLSVVERLRPGVSEEEIDRRTEPLGLRLPVEAKVWFGWHDGAEPASFEVEIAPAFAIFTLDRAIEWRDELLLSAERTHEIARRNGAEPRHRSWLPEWFPIVKAFATVACDCSVPEGAPTPMRAVDPGSDQYWYEPKAASFGEMIAMWIRSWDTGAWYADLERDVPMVRRTQPDGAGRRNYLLDT